MLLSVVRRAGLLAAGLIALCHTPLPAQTCLGARMDAPGHRALRVTMGSNSPTAIGPDHLALQASTRLPRGVLGVATLEAIGGSSRLGLGGAVALVRLGTHASLCPVAAIHVDSGLGGIVLPLGISLGARLPLGATDLELMPSVTPQLRVLERTPHLRAELLLGYRSLVVGLSAETRDASGGAGFYGMTLGWRRGR